jgi:hypothetical protein
MLAFAGRRKENPMKILSRRWLLAAAVAIAVSAVTATQALGGSTDPPGAARGLGQLSGLLPRDHLTEESAIQVDLTKESVRLPLYRGEADGKTVWFVLLDASDSGLAHDLGVNFAPKLANLAIGCPACVQTATASWASTSRPPPRPASSWSPGSTCCSSRASTPASRSSTSAPTPASP